MNSGDSYKLLNNINDSPNQSSKKLDKMYKSCIYKDSNLNNRVLKNIVQRNNQLTITRNSIPNESFNDDRGLNLIKSLYKFNLYFMISFLGIFLVFYKELFLFNNNRIIKNENEEKMNTNSFSTNNLNTKHDKRRSLIVDKSDHKLTNDEQIELEDQSELDVKSSSKYSHLAKQQFANKIINKEFKGTWSSTTQLANFKYETGMITGHVVNTFRYSSKGFDEEVLLFNLNICDDKYVDRWWHALLGHVLIDNSQKSSYEINSKNEIQEALVNKKEAVIDIQENSLSSEEFSTILTYGEFLHHSEDQICKLKL